MIDRFEGRVGVITGAGSGIGRELAVGLTRLGMSVALIDIGRGRLAESAALLAHPKMARTYVADVGAQDAVERVAAGVAADLGAPSLLVNSAGRLGPVGKKAWEYTAREWKDLFAVNLYGTVNCVRAFLPGIRELTGPSHIVNIASAAGVLPGDRTAPYFASKHAVVAFTENLELELRAEGSAIGVSLVCPGAVRTNINLEARASGNVRSPSSDWLEPDDVAGQIIDAARSGRFYVFTHASSVERLRRYQRRVVAPFPG